MRILEISTQAIVGFSPRTQTRLPEGNGPAVLTAPTSSMAPMAQLLSDVFYGDSRGGMPSLSAGNGAGAAVVLQGKDGGAYQVVRQFGSRWLLAKFDPSTRGWVELCRDSQDVTDVLRASCGLPTKNQFEAIFAHSTAFQLPALASPPPESSGARLGTLGGSLPLGTGGFGMNATPVPSNTGFGSPPPAKFGFGSSPPKGFGSTSLPGPSAPRFGSGGPGAFGVSATPSPRFGSGGPGNFGTGGPGTFGSMPEKTGFSSSALGPSSMGMSAPVLPPLPKEEAQKIREKLKAEMEAVRAMDELQFELEGLQQKTYHSREKLDVRDKLKALVASREASLQEMGPPVESRGVDVRTIDKIIGLEGAVTRRDAGLKELKDEATHLGDQLAAVATKPIWKRPLIIGATLLGILCMVLGVVFSGGVLGFSSLLAIPAFGWIAFTAIRWLDETELERGLRQRMSRLEQDERKITDTFTRDYGCVEAAMAQLGVSSGRELAEQRRARAECELALKDAQASLRSMESSEEFKTMEQEAKVAAQKITEVEAKLAQVSKLATRDITVVESELKALEDRQSNKGASGRRMTGEIPMAGQRFSTGGGGFFQNTPSAGGASDADGRIPVTLKLASELSPGVRPEKIAEGIVQRSSQYWAAFTGRSDRVVAFSPNLDAIPKSTTGASLPPIPVDERDLLYLSIRLALLEEFVVPAQMPVVVEDPSIAWPRQRAALLFRAMQHIAAKTQVLFVSSAPEFSSIQGAMRL